MSTTHRVLACLLVASTVGCARNVVQPMSENSSTSLPRPARVLVYDPAVTAAEVTQNRDFIATTMTPGGGQDERAEIGRQAADAFADEVVEGITKLGLRAERARRDTQVPDTALLVVAQFLDVDEGNRVNRLVVGFGSGASRIDTRVQIYYSSHGHRTKVLEFETHSDSGKMPGAAATMGAGAVVTGGVTAASAVGAAAVGGVKAYRSAVERMAAKSAEQATAYLSEYFGRQGWIAKDRVNEANQ